MLTIAFSISSIHQLQKKITKYLLHCPVTPHPAAIRGQNYSHVLYHLYIHVYVYMYTTISLWGYWEEEGGRRWSHWMMPQSLFFISHEQFIYRNKLRFESTSRRVCWIRRVAGRSGCVSTPRRRGPTEQWWTPGPRLLLAGEWCRRSRCWWWSGRSSGRRSVAASPILSGASGESRPEWGDKIILFIYSFIYFQNYNSAFCCALFVEQAFGFPDVWRIWNL